MRRRRGGGGRLRRANTVAGVGLEGLDVGALRLERVAELGSGDEDAPMDVKRPHTVWWRRAGVR